jgi:competence protein ComEC
MLSKSKIFIIVCLSFILGIFLGPILPFDLTIFIVLVIIFLSILLLFGSDPVVKILALIILSLIFGIWRYKISEPKVSSMTARFYNEKKVYLSGIVSDEPDVRKDKTNLALDVNQLKLRKSAKWQKVEGKVLLQVRRYPEYKYGDVLEMEGELETPPEFPDFSYRDYLSRYGIYSLMRNPQVKQIGEGQGNCLRCFLLNIKAKFAAKIDQTLPEPQSSLLAGLLYGAKRGIPTEIMDNFNKAGLTHIVVISGYNITIIASMLLVLLGGLPRRLSFILAFSGIVLFTIFVGAGASVVRAAIMGSIALLAFRVERKSNVLAALFLAAIIMLLWNPKILRFDIGYQLSFLSTAGLIFLAPYLDKFFKWLPKILAESASLTLAAQIFAVPIILYNFRRISLIAPLANVLVLPTVPITMLFGFIGSAAGFIFVPLGQFINWASWFLLTYTIKVAQVLSCLPFASLEFGRLSVFWLILYYVLLGGFLIWPVLHKKMQNVNKAKFFKFSKVQNDNSKFKNDNVS